jgi:Ca2+-binding RTX toxin-like protein
MSRRTTLGAGISLGAIIAVPATAQAEDFTVTNLDDSGAGSLRDAVEDANSDTAPDRILFRSKLSGEITLTGGELYIDTPIEIRGPGARRLTISGGGDSRIFMITPPFRTDVSISGLRLSDGHAQGRGGAIFVEDADFTLSESAVTGNVAEDWGGGVYAYESDARIVDSTISDNRALGGLGGDGGGIFTFDEMRLENSTVSGNSATGGGGIEVVVGPLTLRNSTVAGNEAAERGGGILSIQAPVDVQGSIVADNAAELEGPDLDEYFPILASFGGEFNLIENPQGGGDFEGSNNILGVDPRLKPLKDNGGPTDTHAFKKSLAKNRLPKSETPKQDQRGAKRKGKGDIGAYELVKCEGVIVNRVGTGRKDKLKGTKRKDGILGLGGNDKLSGKKGADGLCGGRGKDKLKGGPGRDRLNGGPGKDKEIQ